MILGLEHEMMGVGECGLNQLTSLQRGNGLIVFRLRHVSTCLNFVTTRIQSRNRIPPITPPTPALPVPLPFHDTVNGCIDANRVPRYTAQHGRQHSEWTRNTGNA